MVYHEVRVRSSDAKVFFCQDELSEEDPFLAEPRNCLRLGDWEAAVQKLTEELGKNPEYRIYILQNHLIIVGEVLFFIFIFIIMIIF